MELDSLRPRAAPQNSICSPVRQEGDDDIQLDVEYSTDLFDAPTIAWFVRHFAILLAEAIRHPDTMIDALPLWEAEQLQHFRQADGTLPYILDPGGQLAPVGVVGDVYRNDRDGRGGVHSPRLANQPEAEAFER